MIHFKSATSVPFFKL